MQHLDACTGPEAHQACVLSSYPESWSYQWQNKKQLNRFAGSLCEMWNKPYAG